MAVTNLHKSVLELSPQNAWLMQASRTLVVDLKTTDSADNKKKI